MDEAQDWPLAVRTTEPLLAWCPPEANPALAAVPVTPGDLKEGLTPAGYRRRLSQRVAWMVNQEDDPEAAVAALAREMESRGLWSLGRPEENPVSALLADNPAWPDYLNLVVQLPEARPMPVRRMSAALQAIQETGLDEWISLAFLPMDDLT